MNLPKGKKLLRIVSAATLTVTPLSGLLFSNTALAAGQLTSVMVRFNSMKVGTFTSGTVCAIPTSTGTEGQVAVTFPTGFTVDTTAAHWTVDTTNTAWPKTPPGFTVAATAWPSIATASAVAGQTVTFPSGDLTVGTLYCFNWTDTTQALKQPLSQGSSELGSVATQTAGSANIDSSQFATATLTDNTVVVTATVPPLFQMSMNTNADSLGTINTLSPIETSGTKPAVTVSTNAKNGWQLWGSDNNAGLKSAQAGNYTIASHTGTLTTGQEFYNTGVFSKSQVGGAGTVSIASGWDDTTDNKTGGGLGTTPQLIASSNGTADTSVITLVNNLVIKATTPAATDYTDTQNYTAAGMF